MIATFLNYMHSPIILLILLIGISQSSRSQSDEEKWFLDNDTIYQLTRSTINKFDLDELNLASSDTIYTTDNIDLSEYDLLKFDKTYLFKKTGGLLYVLKGQKIERIDNSYDHKLHLHSLKIYNDQKIKIIGGYGFFERRKSLVSFSKDKNEWFLEKITGDFPNEGISEIYFHILDQDDLIICGGITGDINDVSISHQVNDCYQINLKNNKSRKLFGKLEQSFRNKPTSYIQIEDFLYVFYDDLVFKINIESFEAVKIKIPFRVNKIIGQSKGTLFFFEKGETNINAVKKLNVYDLKNGVTTKLFDFKTLKYSIYFIISLVLIGMIYFIIKRTKKLVIIIDKNQVKIGKKKFTDQKDWIDLIKILSEKNHVENNELLTKLGNEELNLGHQNRLKNILINNVNNRSQHLFKMDLVLSGKHKTDKRIKIYFLNPSFHSLKNKQTS